MKKMTAALLILSVFLLALNACQPPVSDTPSTPSPEVSDGVVLSPSPSPSPSQSESLIPTPAPTPDAEIALTPEPSDSVEVSPSPEPSADVEPSPSPEPSEEVEIAPSPEPEPSAEMEVTPAPAPEFQASIPDFLVDFDFDRADWLDINEARDYAICLMDEGAQATLYELLGMESWTDAEDIPPMGFEPSCILYDHAGNSLTVTPWDEGTCLIIAAEYGAGEVYRYLAPSSVCSSFLTFVGSLTPLPGTVSYSEELYYDLFRQDGALEVLVGMSTPDGSISDEQVLLYCERRADNYIFTYPYIPYSLDGIAQRHFGRNVPDITVTGRDFHFGVFLVLESESFDEDGTITAQFKCYCIPEYYWLDDVLPDLQMRHIKEHLLTGNDEGFPESFPVEIIFEIGFDVSTQIDYIFYHSLKVLS